ncbi:MFS transporter [Lactobacillus helveticus]|nr:MFS transporter [Lactobacillus helveticus]EEW68436.1 transporter, major facilitator family protein [Lactobacillus helveticus DSM 20075 = CGMCC 1.1877]MCS8611290.1 MFS transporter [Lactobacillus helveticus]MCT3394260.1 MFS transporter [Lactobacillus helveticus]MCT3409737.1 MFS transporter [Lactobacillus helveticus]MCT3412922.1 MFS transporter [Lactobacillus helveticus]
MPVHLRVMIAVVLGQIACGYALGISGTALSNVAKYINISNLWTGLIGAGSLIGLAGSLLIGRLSDKIGRRKLLMSNMYILAGLTLLHLLTANLLLTFIIRIGIGLMIAVDYTVGNSLLTEWLPKDEDSKRQSHLLIYWTIGFILSYIAGTLITGFSAYTWQVILATGAVPAIITALFRSFFPLPASPTWLASKGKVKKANKIISKHMGRKWRLPKRFMKKKKKTPKNISWAILFSKKYLRRTLVGGIFYACQAFSFFGISIFLPILLSSMNITDSNISGIIYNGGMFVDVLFGIFIFNRISRRAFLVGNFLTSAVLFGIFALVPGLNSMVKLTIFTIFAIILSSGLVLDYPYPTELFDIKVRGTGVGTCITISRFGAAACTFLLSVLTNVGGAKLAMLVCAIVLLFAFIVCLIWAPETLPKFMKKEQKTE